MIARSLLAFDGVADVTELAVAVPPGYIETAENIIKAYNIKKVRNIVIGGESRQASVYNALRAISGETDIVLIHDAARPFVTKRNILDIIGFTERGFAAVAGTKITDTVKSADAGALVQSTLPRDGLWAAQTPQGFAYGIIMRAHEQAAKDAFTGTDDAALVERLNLAPVIMVECGRANIKITTKEDLL